MVAAAATAATPAVAALSARDGGGRDRWGERGRGEKLEGKAGAAVYICFPRF